MPFSSTLRCSIASRGIAGPSLCYSPLCLSFAQLIPSAHSIPCLCISLLSQELLLSALLCLRTSLRFRSLPCYHKSSRGFSFAVLIVLTQFLLIAIRYYSVAPPILAGLCNAFATRIYAIPRPFRAILFYAIADLCNAFASQIKSALYDAIPLLSCLSFAPQCHRESVKAVQILCGSSLVRSKPFHCNSALLRSVPFGICSTALRLMSWRLKAIANRSDSLLFHCDSVPATAVP